MPRLLKWLLFTVKTAPLVCILLLPLLANAQENATLTLSEAFQKAESHYPMLLQKDLVQLTEKLSLQNINTAYLPQPAINGQATYQSDVTGLSIPLAGFNVPSPGKDQYRIVAGVEQLLYDGGMVKAQKEIQHLNTGVEQNKVAVELYGLKARINQLYFTILLQEELLQQNELVSKNIQAGIDKVQPQVQNGTILRSNLLVLQAEKLLVKQKAIEITAARKGLIEMLSLYLGQPLDENLHLKKPQVALSDTMLHRPELQLFQSQSDLVAGQKKLISSRNMPRANAFFQGGYGRPGLNLLSNEFKPFYIGGFRFNWPLGGLYTAAREKKLVSINQQTIELQKQTFLLNTRSQLQQQQADIDKYSTLLATDKEIIELRRQVTESAKAQLENAVITSNDFLIQVNAEDNARQAMILHELQLLQAQVNYQITSGKL
ncbi:MAG TPA: TolC family protein [Flavisolibacter sp.]|nr:TolC family protein [Flavisolibacter sp.]